MDCSRNFSGHLILFETVARDYDDVAVQRFAASILAGPEFSKLLENSQFLSQKNKNQHLHLYFTFKYIHL